MSLFLPLKRLTYKECLQSYEESDNLKTKLKLKNKTYHGMAED